MTDDLHRERIAWLDCVEAAARERLAQAIQEGKQPQGTAWNGHYLTAAKAILTAAGVPALLAALDRERQRTRKGVRTPAPGYENAYVAGNVHAAVCAERDEEQRLASHYLAEAQRRHQALNCIHAFLADIETSSLSMVEVKEIVRQWCDEANGYTEPVSVAAPSDRSDRESGR